MYNSIQHFELFVPYGHLFLHLAILELLEMVALVVYCYTLLAKFVFERKR